MTGPSNAAALLGAWVAAALVVLPACGGTNGREDLPNGGNPSSVDQDATVAVQADGSGALDSGSDGPPDGAIEGAADNGFDATLGDDSGDAGLDVDIMYADAARLPHFEGGGVGADAGVESGPPPLWASWPACACDNQPADPTACPIPDDAGGCQHFVWTRSEVCDQCMRYNCDGLPPDIPVLFPPCCDFSRDGGVATTGPGTGILKFQLCAELYVCMFQAYRPGSVVSSAYCGDAGTTAECVMPGAANGPCKSEIEKAFESSDPTFILPNFTNQRQGQLYSSGGEIGALFACQLANCSQECLSDDGGVMDAAPDVYCYPGM